MTMRNIIVIAVWDLKFGLYKKHRRKSLKYYFCTQCGRYHLYDVKMTEYKYPIIGDDKKCIGHFICPTTNNRMYVWIPRE